MNFQHKKYKQYQVISLNVNDRPVPNPRVQAGIERFTRRRINPLPLYDIQSDRHGSKRWKGIIERSKPKPHVQPSPTMFNRRQINTTAMHDIKSDHNSTYQWKKNKNELESNRQLLPIPQMFARRHRMDLKPLYNMQRNNKCFKSVEGRKETGESSKPLHLLPIPRSLIRPRSGPLSLYDTEINQNRSKHVDGDKKISEVNQQSQSIIPRFTRRRDHPCKQYDVHHHINHSKPEHQSQLSPLRSTRRRIDKVPLPGIHTFSECSHYWGGCKERPKSSQQLLPSPQRFNRRRIHPQSQDIKSDINSYKHFEDNTNRQLLKPQLQPHRLKLTQCKMNPFPQSTVRGQVSQPHLQTRQKVFSQHNIKPPSPPAIHRDREGENSSFVNLFDQFVSVMEDSDIPEEIDTYADYPTYQGDEMVYSDTSYQTSSQSTYSDTSYQSSSQSTHSGASYNTFPDVFLIDEGYSFIYENYPDATELPVQEYQSPKEDGAQTNTLRKENDRLKEERTCKICLDQGVTIAIIPCGHAVACGDCAKQLNQCPVCRGQIKNTLRIYMN